MSNTNPNTQSLDKFCNMLGQFIDACITVWPEDPALKEYKQGFSMIMNPAMGSLGLSGKQKLAQEYYDSLSPFFSRCLEKDVTLFTEENIPILEEVHLREKWLDNSISEQTRETIWAYILELNRLCSMYISLFSRIPSDALNKIQKTADELALKMSSGAISMEELDLMKIGEEVVSGLSEEDMQGFMNGVLSDPTALAQLASSLAPVQGMDPSTILQAMNGGGVSNDLPAQLMSMMMQQQMNSSS